MALEKIKMTKAEFDEFYELEEEDTEDVSEDKKAELEFLTEEEQVYDTDMYRDLPQEDKVENAS